MKSNNGFTIVEMVIAIGIAVILTTVIFISVNPIKQFARSRDNRRLIDVNAILTAVSQNMTESRGYLSCSGGATTTVPTTSVQIGRATGNFNLESCLAPVYISAVPMDPKIGTPSSTGYYILRNATSSAVTIIASSTEATGTISVTR
ncbi:type II secretion system protein [Candidatus Wolfebacteria bacterium]|nr:type II secretion system protein [Candidatus Wolfebacteria bacterium]